MKGQIPEFPTKLAFQHGFEAYAGAYLNMNDWICPAYNFAIALGQASTTLGKKVKINELGYHYPNFYQCLVGRSHIAAKSPSINRLRDGIATLQNNTDPPETINIINSVNSAEQLKAEFETHDKGKRDEPYDWYINNNGVRCIIALDELCNLLTKGLQAATSSIPGTIMELYNPSKAPITNKIRSGTNTYGENWSLNIFAATTFQSYEKFIKADDFQTGFLNRFVFYLHEQQPLHSRFNKPDNSFLGTWQDILNGVSRQCMEYEQEREFVLSDEAFEVYDKWYHEIYKELIKNDADDIKTAAVARIITHALKLALVYATFGNSLNDDTISLSQFESAKAVAEYWGECMGLTINEMSASRRGQCEKIIIDKIKMLEETSGKGEVTVRKVRQAINAKSMDSYDFNSALESLITAEQVYLLVLKNGKKLVSQEEFIAIDE